MNLGVNRLFAPFCLSRSRFVEWYIYLLKGMAPEFWITRFTHVTVYVYLVKYDVLFYAYGFLSYDSFFSEGAFMSSITVFFRHNASDTELLEVRICSCC